jgi:hypothetical protein
VELTQASASTASKYLQAADWDVLQAVNTFFERNPSRAEVVPYVYFFFFFLFLKVVCSSVFAHHP